MEAPVGGLREHGRVQERVFSSLDPRFLSPLRKPPQRPAEPERPEAGRGPAVVAQLKACAVRPVTPRLAIALAGLSVGTVLAFLHPSLPGREPEPARSAGIPSQAAPAVEAAPVVERRRPDMSSLIRPGEHPAAGLPSPLEAFKALFKAAARPRPSQVATAAAGRVNKGSRDATGEAPAHEAAPRKALALLGSAVSGGGAASSAPASKPAAGVAAPPTKDSPAVERAPSASRRAADAPRGEARALKSPAGTSPMATATGRSTVAAAAAASAGPSSAPMIGSAAGPAPDSGAGPANGSRPAPQQTASDPAAKGDRRAITRPPDKSGPTDADSRAAQPPPPPDATPSESATPAVEPTSGQITTPDPNTTPAAASTDSSAMTRLAPAPSVGSIKPASPHPDSSHVVSKEAALDWIQQLELGDEPLTKEQAFDRIAAAMPAGYVVDMGNGLSYKAEDLLKYETEHTPSGTYTPDEIKRILTDMTSGKFVPGAPPPPAVASNNLAIQWIREQFDKLPAGIDTPAEIRDHLASMIPPGSLVTIGCSDYDALTLLNGFTAVAIQYNMPPSTMRAFIETALANKGGQSCN